MPRTGGNHAKAIPNRQGGFLSFSIRTGNRQNRETREQTGTSQGGQGIPKDRTGARNNQGQGGQEKRLEIATYRRFSIVFLSFLPCPILPICLVKIQAHKTIKKWVSVCSPWLPVCSIRQLQGQSYFPMDLDFRRFFQNCINLRDSP